MDQSLPPRLLLEIVSDTICPWCYIGKRRLDAALDLIGSDLAFDLRWRPFELNPDMPLGGLDRKAYRSAKFGSWEKSQALDAQVHDSGVDAGLDFHHDRMAKTPNTLASHVLVRVAYEAGLQGAVVEAVFAAYFTDGLDVGDPEVLTRIGVSCGLDEKRVRAALADDGLRYDVKSEATAFAAAGVTGVPSVLLNRHLLFSGAQAPERIADILRRAAAKADIVGTGVADLVGGVAGG